MILRAEFHAMQVVPVCTLVLPNNIACVAQVGYSSHQQILKANNSKTRNPTLANS